jgi:hypothetical protein
VVSRLDHSKPLAGKRSEPLSLSDSELDAVMQAAAPLHPFDRSAFLSSVARRLKAEPVTGPGTVNRVIREALATKQFQLADAMAVGNGVGSRKQAWRRGS